MADVASALTGPIGSALTLAIGIAVGLLLYKLALRDRLPVWDIRNRQIIGRGASRLPGLEIRFGSHSVEQLSSAIVAIWNAGHGVIDKVDIETTNALRIQAAEGVLILSAEVVAVSNGASEFRIELDEPSRSVVLSFSYLNHNWGAAVQVIHTGNSSRSIAVTGDVKGVNAVKRRQVAESLNVYGELIAIALSSVLRRRFAVRSARRVGSLITLAAACILVFNSLSKVQESAGPEPISLAIGVFLGIVGMLDYLRLPPPGLEIIARDP